MIILADPGHKISTGAAEKLLAQIRLDVRRTESSS